MAAATRIVGKRPGMLRSEMYYEIFRRFRKEGLEIPFPQMDVYIKQGQPSVNPAALRPKDETNA